jgi:hypothetical protein
MRLVQIEGAEEVVRGLADLPDVILVPPTTEPLGDGRISMAAYASGRAVAEIESRGATVTTKIDDAELGARLADLDSHIESPPTEPPAVG